MTETTETNIFLAIVPPSGDEIHVRWRGHASKDAAEKEMAVIRKLMINQRKKPYDCYIYEGSAPLYGLKAYELDDVDMNFYEETNQQDLEEMQDKLQQAIYEVGVLAEEERKNARKSK